MVKNSWLWFLAIGVTIAFILIVGSAHASESARKGGGAQGWVTAAVRAPGLEQRVFYSPSVKSDVSYHVYTPDLYDSDNERRFPVIYWLHGYQGGGAKQLPQLVEHFDLAMREGKIPSALIVFPNGMKESMWVNSKDGQVPMETVLIKELIPNVDATYRTIASRFGRLIEGFSMGGYGAARLGFKYPEVFGSISILGAGPMQRAFEPGADKMTKARIRILANVYGNDQTYYLAQSPLVLAEQYANATRDKILVRIAVGSDDAMLRPNRDFAGHLSTLGVPYDFQEVPNVGHAPFPLFRALGEANWNFYRVALAGKVTSEQLGVTETPKSITTITEGRSSVPEIDRRQRLLERLRRFDYDEDGVVNVGDLPPPARARFQSLDSNGNGQLDMGELD